MVTMGHRAQRELKLKPTGFTSVYSTPDFKIWTCERAALLDRRESQLKKNPLHACFTTSQAE